jgi:hypothetical protein
LTVRTQYDCYGCEPANFGVERCDGADCAAADDEDILLVIVSYERGIEGDWGGLEKLKGLHVLESSSVDRAHVVYVSGGLGDVKS